MRCDPFSAALRLCLKTGLLLATVLPVLLKSAPLPSPPPTRTVDVVDTLFGTPVPDPYRWLENGNSPEVQKWTAAQYAHYRLFVDGFPFAGMTSLFNSAARFFHPSSPLGATMLSARGGDVERKGR